MTPESVQAVEALARSTESLARSIADRQNVPAYFWLLGPIALLIGIAVSECLARLRERRQREHERRLLAGALAAELRGFLALWGEVQPEGKPATATGVIVAWGVQQSYSSVFDASGNRLFLLGQDRLQEVSVCYFKLKRALDNLTVSQRVTEFVQTFGRQHEWQQMTRPQSGGVVYSYSYADLPKRASDAAIETARRAVQAIEQLLPKLDGIAAGRREQRTNAQ